MGGHNGNNGDAMEWTEDCEKFFLEILIDRVGRDPNGAPIIKRNDWIEMEELIFSKFSLRYGLYKLKGKYNRLRIMHTKFSELINHVGVTWDSNFGKVFADDTVWNAYLKRDKIFKSFKKKGCKIYPLLNVVFGSYMTSGAFYNASTCAPQTSEEEQRIEQECLGENDIGQGKVGRGESIDRGKGKRHVDGDLHFFPGERGVKENSGNDRYDTLMDVLSQSLIARMEKDLAKAKRYKAHFSEATSAITEEFSIRDCMVVLNKMPDVSTASYNKAVEYFLDPNWRKIFLLMSKERRKGWVDSFS